MLAQSLRSNIVHGEWKPGDQLPTIPELVTQYGVGTITVRRAFEILIDEGLIRSYRGRGTFVSDNAYSKLQSNNLRSIISDPLVEDPDLKIKVLLRRTVQNLPLELQGRHGEDVGYSQIRKVQLYSGTPFAYIDVFIRSDLYAKFPRGSDTKLRVPKLIELYGEGEVTTLNDQQISFTYADDEIAKALDYTSAGALAKMLRWRTDNSDRIVWASINYFRADMFVLDIIEHGSPFQIQAIRPPKL
jgi:GntR family transcriptional regulator